MPEYLVEPFDTGPGRLKSMQAFINEMGEQGYALVQAVPRNAYHWVLVFALKADVEQPGSSPAS